PQDDVVPLHEPFETALRGFNRQQVLAHVESLEGQISMVTADRESALRQVAELSKAIDHLREESELLVHLRREAEKANERVELMHQAPMVAASSRIQHIVRLAEEEAAELRAQAKKETDELRALAKKETDELRAQAKKEAAELRAQAKKETDELRARAAQDATTHRKQAADEAEAMLRDMTRRCAQLESDSERRRKAAEQHSAQEIARKEGEANDRINTRDRRSIARVHLLLKTVGTQLVNRVATIEQQEAALAESRTRTGQEVRALEKFRANITAQLSTTRQVLAEALEQVQRTTIEEPRTIRPVPIQRDSRPVAEHSAEGASVQLVSSRVDERHHPAAPA
ncbi:MAG: hypothetical protein ACRDRV_15265, partial [Pseudonocardiaceae bacterium]